MWGQVSGCYYGRGDKRIIPTRVGTSLSGSEYRPILRDHPHACGDKIISATVRRNSVGSSPRVWGQGLSALGFRLFLGIIPTRVGTRQFSTPDPRSGRDHPHACGDKPTVGITCSFAIGSSPRVWGQARSLLIHTAAVGIIPTRVGTSFLTVTFSVVKQDHPHACGDKHTCDRLC